MSFAPEKCGSAKEADRRRGNLRKARAAGARRRENGARRGESAAESLLRGEAEAIRFARCRRGIETAAVDHEKTVAIVDAPANVGCGNEAAEHRAGTLGIDREVQTVELIDTRREPAVGTGLHQAIGIKNDGVGIHRCRGCKCRRDDLALGEKALHAGVDEALTELVE